MEAIRSAVHGDNYLSEIKQERSDQTYPSVVPIILVSAPSTASELGGSMSMQIDHVVQGSLTTAKKKCSREADPFCYFAGVS